MKKDNFTQKFYTFGFIIFFICFFNVFGDDPPKYEIHIKFSQTGPRILYCDEYVKLFHTENINFHKVDEDGLKQNINSLVYKDSNEGFCGESIKCNISSIEETIIIEFIGSPQKLKQLFADTQISRIERFDYPYPIEDTNFNGIFYYCSELTYADLSNFSFVNAKDVSNLFYSNPKLEEVIFPNEKAMNIETFSDMFAFSTKIKRVNLTSFSFIKAKDIGYMFNGCENLEEVIFPQNEKAEKIETFNDMFANCRKLKTLNLSCFSFKKARNMAYMFDGCLNLENIIFPVNEKANSLQYCKYMFRGCSKLTSIDISGLSFVNINDISSMFVGCTHLEVLILPQNETANNIQDFSSMFQGCSHLTSIDLSNIDFVNATKLPNMFYGCSNLTTITLPTSSKATKVEKYQSMFIFCKNLKSIDLSNFSFMKAKDLSSMFYYCINLETVILPKDEFTTNIENISYMFSLCFKLKSIDLSGISFKNIKDMSYLFSNCINLETIIYPDDEEYSNIESFSYVYSNCHKLTEINLTKFNLEKVTDISYLFFSCINLEKIIYPIKKMNKIEKLEHTFDNCTKLDSIDFTNIINTGSFVNLDYTFANCKNLKTIKFPKNEEMRNILSMNATFANCTALTSLDLSQIYIDNNVNLVQCFSNCVSLKEINIFNIKTSNSNQTFNFLYRDSLEGCLYHSYDNVNLGEYITNKICSKYIGYHKCGPCINDNENDYCTLNIDGKNFNFYYLDFQSNLPISERECYWSKNYENILGYKFVNNTKKKKPSYFIDYCENYCYICSENRYGCLECKNNLYPIDTEYNEYINNNKDYYFCYNFNEMENYYLNEEIELFIKCSEKCLGCKDGVDICKDCNKDKGFYPVEGKDGECWKDKPTDIWTFDESAQQWRKCNDRCKKCNFQSKSNKDHQCKECADNYYTYYIDYLNFQKGTSNYFNCYTIEEMKRDNKNYYLNGNYFEQCDDSCAECEITKNNCSVCQMNYYTINGFNKHSCFKNPLKGYVVTEIDGKSEFLSCYHLCKYCNHVSQFFLYQQCTECDEINYTKDIYSLNESYCIPKIKPKNNIQNNTYSIKDAKIWYIENYEGIEDLIISNKSLVIDYQRLLKNDQFKNLSYKEDDECPIDKPYIIYETRQCVSSCFSSNLIEFGIFMTHQLYLYNNICYIECPHGSFKDNETFTCKENNKYIYPNKTIALEYYLEIQEDYRKKYLGDGYAKDTIECIRVSDSSIIHHKVLNDINDEEKIQKMKENKIPIIFFPKCINKLKENYNLNQSDNIYIEIIEYNDRNARINSSNFKFFLENGTILNHSCCVNLTMECMKNINRSRCDKTFIHYLLALANSSIDLSKLDNDTLNDCMPLVINDKDWPLKELKSLIHKSKKICGENCSFISFDSNNNYSSCQCIYTDKSNTIGEEIEETLYGTELGEIIKTLIEDGNFKFFFCIKDKKTYEHWKTNYIMYIGVVIYIIEFILFNFYLRCLCCFCCCNSHKIDEQKEVQNQDAPENGKLNYIIKIYQFNFETIKKNLVKKIMDSEKNNLIFDDLSKNNIIIKMERKNDELDLTEDFDDARQKKQSCCKNCGSYLWKYLKEKIVIFFVCNNKDEFNLTLLSIIKIFIFINNYYFMCGFLLTEKYISSRRFIKEHEIIYAITNEKQRACLIIIICGILNFLMFFFFNFRSRIEELEKNYKIDKKDIELYKEKMQYLIKSIKIRTIIGTCLVLIVHSFFLLFNLIFFSIHYNTKSTYFAYLGISFLGYAIFYLLVLLIISLLRTISLLGKNYFFEKLYQLSSFLADLL